METLVLGSSLNWFILIGAALPRRRFQNAYVCQHFSRFEVLEWVFVLIKVCCQGERLWDWDSSTPDTRNSWWTMIIICWWTMIMRGTSYHFQTQYFMGSAIHHVRFVCVQSVQRAISPDIINCPVYRAYRSEPGWWYMSYQTIGGHDNVQWNT